jgi:hypothetical protein
MKPEDLQAKAVKEEGLFHVPSIRRIARARDRCLYPAGARATIDDAYLSLPYNQDLGFSREGVIVTPSVEPNASEVRFTSGVVLFVPSEAIASCDQDPLEVHPQVNWRSFSTTAGILNYIALGYRVSDVVRIMGVTRQLIYQLFRRLEDRGQFIDLVAVARTRKLYYCPNCQRPTARKNKPCHLCQGSHGSQG